MSILSRDLGVKFRPVLKKDAVPTIFSNVSTVSRKRRFDKIVSGSSAASSSSSSHELEPKRPRSAFRKRETARIMSEFEQGKNNSAESCPDIIQQELYENPDVGTQTFQETKPVATQTRFRNHSKGIQTYVCSRDHGVQCSLLMNPLTSTPCQSEEDTDDYDSLDEDSGDETDSSYGGDSDNPEDDSICEEADSDAPAHKQRLFLVSESSLLSLFKFCPECNSECERVVSSRLGTRVTLSQKCLSCTFHRYWDSQPTISDIPVGNIMMSSAILFGGGSPTKVLRIMKHMNVPSVGYSTFMAHQKKFLHPATDQHQSVLLDSIKADGKDLILGGDGRCDSPGHSAKYGSYTLLDVERNKILDTQLVQSNEVKNSNAMEKEGLIRAIQHIKDNGLTIGTLVTDRHTQVRKHMREKEPEIKHKTDGWHVGKGTGKKIDKIAKKRDCARVAIWKKSVINHLFWCASSTDDDEEGDLREAKWMSITNHVMNKHRKHDNPLFPKCVHGRLMGRERKKKWLKAGTTAYLNLCELLTKKCLLKDIRHMSGMYTTSSLESFHSVLNHFAPKLLGFSYHGMTSRLQIAVLHFNENNNREQAKTKEGIKRHSIVFPKFKKGEYTVKKILVRSTYSYVQELTEKVIKIVSGEAQQTMQRAAAPRPISSSFYHPDKETAVSSLISRYRQPSSS